MLRDALTYPVRGPSAEYLLLRGLVLAFAVAGLARLPPPLALAAVVPGLLLLGVLAEVYEDSIAGSTEPRRFESLSTLARRGGTVAVLSTVYLSPAAVAVVVSLVGARSTSVAPASVDFLAATGILLGSTTVLGLALASLYLLPVAIGTVLETGSLRAGLAVRSLLDRSIDGAYFTAFGAGVTLLLATVGLARALAAFGRVGGAVGVVVTFHVLVGATSLVGRGFGTSGTASELL